MEMKTRFTSILSLLLLAVFVFCSCSQKTGLEAATTTQKTERSVKTTATTETDPVATTAPDPFETVRGSDEKWIQYGLAAYDAGKEIPDMSSFFSGIANNPHEIYGYICLYDDLFIYDPENAIPIAEAYFDFIVRNFGVDALLDITRRCEFKFAYLQSVNVAFDFSDLTVSSDPSETLSFFQDMDLVLAKMTCTSNPNWKYILQLNNATYYFKDYTKMYFSYPSLIYSKNVALNEMIAYLNENGFSEWLRTDRHFHYFMTYERDAPSVTYSPAGNMFINDDSTVLHESVHAMGINGAANIWLSEGISNYFGLALGFDEYNDSAGMWWDLKYVEAGYYDPYADAGDPYSIRQKRTFEDYVGHGGSFESWDSIDLRLLFDAKARVELEIETSTLGTVYKEINGKECVGVGTELTYNQATSLIQYLVNTRGLGQVMNAYRTQDIEGNLGKDYAGLKAEWLEYLQQ